MKMKMKTLRQGCLATLLLFLSNCSITKSTSEIVYADAWEKVLNSKAWKDALPNIDESLSFLPRQQFYTTKADIALIEVENPRNTILDPNFETRYDYLVKRAYIQIISQATKADDRIEKEYILRNAAALKKGNRRSAEFDKKLELVNKRYHAHREMLNGLKSWNIYSEYGTNDLEFFKAENEITVQEMLREGKSESAVINYLIYKLADLYHYEV